MRDIALIIIIFGAVPFILARPWLGIVMWSWLGYMNPHRLTWGFAYDYPFAAIAGGATLVGMVFTREKRWPPMSLTLVMWLLFILWMNVCTLFALNPDEAWPQWEKVMKVQLFALLALMLIWGKQRINVLVWVITLSLAFYGIKGGLFTLREGGTNRVYGPMGSFFDDNNSVGLVLIMTVPLLRYLQLQLTDRKYRLAMTGAILLTLAAILSTFSRGAVLGLFAMLAFFVLKTRHRGWIALAMCVALPVMIVSMPQAWQDRMMGISHYEQDGSAQGRINAWHFAANVAADRPLVGGGFEVFRRELFVQYAPNPTDFHDAHSIYFEVLGEQGWVGLLLYVLTGWLAFRTGSYIIRRVKEAPPLLQKDLSWARDLAAMIQVSLAGYATAGAFLGMAYFDLYYSLIGLLLITKREVQERLAVNLEPVVAVLKGTAVSEDRGGQPLPAAKPGGT